MDLPQRLNTRMNTSILTVFGICETMLHSLQSISTVRQVRSNADAKRSERIWERSNSEITRRKIGLSQQLDADVIFVFL